MIFFHSTYHFYYFLNPFCSTHLFFVFLTSCICLLLLFIHFLLHSVFACFLISFLLLSVSLLSLSFLPCILLPSFFHFTIVCLSFIYRFLSCIHLPISNQSYQSLCLPSIPPYHHSVLLADIIST